MFCSNFSISIFLNSFKYISLQASHERCRLDCLKICNSNLLLDSPNLGSKQAGQKKFVLVIIFFAQQKYLNLMKKLQLSKPLGELLMSIHQKSLPILRSSSQISQQQKSIPSRKELVGTVTKKLRETKLVLLYFLHFLKGQHYKYSLFMLSTQLYLSYSIYQYQILFISYINRQNPIRILIMQYKYEHQFIYIIHFQKKIRKQHNLYILPDTQKFHINNHILFSKFVNFLTMKRLVHFYNTELYLNIHFIIKRIQEKMNTTLKLWLRFSNTFIVRLKLFIFRPNQLSPLIFFLIYLFRILGLLPIIELQINSLLLLGIITFGLLISINPYFYCIPLLYFDGISFKIISIVLGLCSINQPNKILLFLFTLPSALFSPSLFQVKIFQFFFALFSSFLIYKKLLFNSLPENSAYYIGFSIVGLLSAQSLANDIFSIQTGPQFKASLISLFYYFSVMNFEKRVQQVKLCQLFKVKNFRKALWKIKLIQDDSEQFAFQFSDHWQKCSRIDCFCKEISEKPYQQAWNPPKHIKLNFIHYLYLYFLNQIKQSSVHEKNYFLTELIAFYLQNNQPIKAITIVKNSLLESESYFSRVLKYRVDGQIKKNIKQSHYFLSANEKFYGIFSYDLHANFLKSKIYEILGKKIMFWDELCCEMPQVRKLEIFGSQAIDQIESLHQLVAKKIIPIQEETKIYECSLLYASYLILTTNFTEYADKLVKNINKSIVQTQMIQSMKKCFSGVQVSMEEERAKGSRQIFFRLVIVNISSNLVKTLNKEKSELINEDLDVIIPQFFRGPHYQRLNAWVKSPKAENGESYFINHYREIPFRINEKLIFYTGFEVRLHLDHVSNQINFQGILLSSGTQGQTILANLDGQILFRQPLIPQQILVHPQIQETLKQIKEEFKVNQYITPKQQCVQTKDTAHYLVFKLFVQPTFKQNPIIKIKCENDNAKKLKFIKNPREQREHFKNNTIDTGSSASIQESAFQEIPTTQKIIQILEGDKIKWDSINCLRIYAIFVLIGSVLIVVSYRFIFLNYSVIEPLLCIYSVSQIQTYQFCAISIEHDIQLYQSNDSQYQKLMEKAINSPNYVQRQHQNLKNLSKKLEDGYFMHIMDNKGSFVDDWIQEFYEKQIKIEFVDPTYEHVVKVLKFQEIVARVITQMRYHFKYNQGDTVLASIFTHQNLEYFYEITYSTENRFNKELQKLFQLNIIIAMAYFVLVVIISLIFLKVLKIYKASNLAIFNVFTSLSTSLICQEIQHFQDIRSRIDFNNMTPNLTDHIVKGITYKIDRQCVSKQISKQASCFTLKSKLRIRSGELVTQKSSIDQNRLNFTESIFYAFVFVLLGLVLWIMCNKIEQSAYEKQIKEEVFYLKNDIFEMTFQLYQAKIFYDLYDPSVISELVDSDVIEHLRESTLDFFQQEKTKSRIYQAEILHCMEESLICQQNYSYPILRGIVKKAIYDTFNIKEEKLRAESQGKQYVGLYDLKIMRSQLFLAQEAIQRIYIISESLVSGLQEQLKEYQAGIDDAIDEKVSYYYHFLPFFSGYLLMMCIIMKKKYKKNLMLLTFLNKDMAYQNKRVQSFLNRITEKIK